MGGCVQASLPEQLFALAEVFFNGLEQLPAAGFAVDYAADGAAAFGEGSGERLYIAGGFEIGPFLNEVLWCFHRGFVFVLLVCALLP
jgi:hypothetical protein